LLNELRELHKDCIIRNYYYMWTF